MQNGAAHDSGGLSAAAFTQFYRAHLATVFGYLVRLCGGDRSCAEDLTQDTFLALTAELKLGHTDAADIRWLLTVARHKYVDHLRREERSQRHLRLAASTPELKDDQPPSRADVLDQVAALDPLPRVVLILRYVDGMPVESIAREIGRSVAATYSLLARARRELRRSRGDGE